MQKRGTRKTQTKTGTLKRLVRAPKDYRLEVVLTSHKRAVHTEEAVKYKKRVRVQQNQKDPVHSTHAAFVGHRSIGPVSVPHGQKEKGSYTQFTLLAWGS